jgi:hypothetical protein
MAAVPPNAGSSPDGGAVVVLGMSWETGEPQLRLRAIGGPPDRRAVPSTRSELVAAAGLELNYRVPAEPTRHCIGTLVSSQGGYKDCLNRPQRSEKTCVNCAVAEATFASNLHHAHTRDRDELDRSVVDHLDQTNILYLAAFRDGSVKVGTSTEHRKVKRWTEQGAWRTVEVALVADGFTVRKLEDVVTDKLDVPQAVSVKRKLTGMTGPHSIDSLDAKLTPLVDDVHDLIESLDRLPGTTEPVSETVETTANTWSFPGGDQPVWDRLHPYPTRLDTGTHHLEVVAMCGRVAVVRRPGADDRFVVDIGQLFGVELDLGRYEPDQLTIQDSLF